MRSTIYSSKRNNSKSKVGGRGRRGRPRRGTKRRGQRRHSGGWMEHEMDAGDAGLLGTAYDEFSNMSGGYRYAETPPQVGTTDFNPSSMGKVGAVDYGTGKDGKKVGLYDQGPRSPGDLEPKDYGEAAGALGEALQTEIERENAARMSAANSPWPQLAST